MESRDVRKAKGGRPGAEERARAFMAGLARGLDREALRRMALALVGSREEGAWRSQRESNPR